MAEGGRSQEVKYRAEGGTREQGYPWEPEQVKAQILLRVFMAASWWHGGVSGRAHEELEGARCVARCSRPLSPTTSSSSMRSKTKMKNDAKIRSDAATGMIRALSLGIGLYHEVDACAARGRGTRVFRSRFCALRKMRKRGSKRRDPKSRLKRRVRRSRGQESRQRG